MLKTSNNVVCNDLMTSINNIPHGHVLFSDKYIYIDANINIDDF